MVVAEQRLPLPFALAKSVQVRVQRVGEIASTPRAIDRVGGTRKRRTMMIEKVLPGALDAGGARTRQRQVSDVQRLDVPLDVGCGRRPVREGVAANTNRAPNTGSTAPNGGVLTVACSGSMSLVTTWTLL